MPKDPSKTEPPTPKRLSESREKGQVAKSQEVPSVMVLLAAMLCLFLMGGYIYENIVGIMRDIFTNVNTFHTSKDNIMGLLLMLGKRIFYIIGPVIGVIIVVAILGNVMQFGLLLTFDPLTPDINKLNVVSGIKKLVSTKSFVELIKSVLKILIVGYVAYMVVKKELPFLPVLIDMEPIQILIYVMKTSLEIFFYVSLVLIVLAIFDYTYQKWDYKENLKMTKQEVKDEFKQREGDPQVRSRVRSMQREMAMRRMMEMVPRADVVITNPTSLAVALRYDNKTMVAPQVVAKGARLIADKIKEVARKAGIPIVEDKWLAQALYKSADVGEYVPPELYKAVAEVLAYIYNLREGMAG